MAIAHRRLHRPSVLTNKAYFQQPRLRIRILREPRQPAVPAHRHEFFEIVIVLAGSGHHVTGTSQHTVGSGDILVINNRRTHAYAWTHDLKLINIIVRNQVIARLNLTLGPMPGYRDLFCTESRRWQQKDFQARLHLSAADLLQCEQWASQMETESWEDARIGTALAEGYLTLLVALLARKHYAAQVSPLPLSNIGLRSVCRQLETQKDERMAVPELARIAGMSQRTLQRVFNRTFGTTASPYATRMRLRRAIELLRQNGPDLRIAEIASRCGYDDSNYFSRCFHRLMGQSPRDYRKAYLGTTKLNK